jgi:tetratricopeptide (TPR) repeat protein
LSITNVDNIYGDENIEDFKAVEDSLRYFREYAKRGIKRFQERDMIGALADFERAHRSNASQPLIQRGIALYCSGDYARAADHLAADLEILEKSKIFKASDVRIWLSAALNKLGRRQEAIAILDHSNKSPTGLAEKRMFMNMTLCFYADELPLEEMMEFIGGVDEKDTFGFAFFGNFYLGLYYDSIGNRDFAKTFLQFAAASTRYPEKDMWYHVPRVLYDARHFDDEVSVNDTI